MVLEPPIDGHDVLLQPCYAFLITHDEGNDMRKVVFDLGIRQDFHNLPPLTRGYTVTSKATVERDMADILSGETISAVIWR